jgi:hypothetical protein
VVGGEFDDVVGDRFECPLEGDAGVRGGREERDRLGLGVVPASGEFVGDVDRRLERHSR